MMIVLSNSARIECLQGNIIDQTDCDILVNAANAELLPGGGVCGAIHMAAGPALAAECMTLSPIKPGQCVVTAAYSLPNRFIIHAVGPIYGEDKPERNLLESAYSSSIRAADRRGATSIAFPSLSTGVFGYPIEEAAPVALTTALACADECRHLKLIRFVLFTDNEIHCFEKHLALLNAS